MDKLDYNQQLELKNNIKRIAEAVERIVAALERNKDETIS